MPQYMALNLWRIGANPKLTGPLPGWFEHCGVRVPFAVDSWRVIFLNGSSVWVNHKYGEVVGYIRGYAACPLPPDDCSGPAVPFKELKRQLYRGSDAITDQLHEAEVDGKSTDGIGYQPGVYDDDDHPLDYLVTESQMKESYDAVATHDQALSVEYVIHGAYLMSMDIETGAQMFQWGHQPDQQGWLTGDSTVPGLPIGTKGRLIYNYEDQKYRFEAD